ncbi:hypothetical protein N7450_010105 [Penicillium hetheringtonii]|uniref:Uncharacterized protein n=1 Tax=Penicillium hetheringtonii TaxID=911720 RepID=A0AAD6DD39_9EURO|nr:hypothetical protein N7450_010105 [Penicillium hetheringtonii]
MECQQGPDILPQPFGGSDLGNPQDTTLAPLTVPFGPVLTNQMSKPSELSIAPFSLKPDSQLRGGHAMVLAHRPLSALLKKPPVLEVNGDRDSHPMTSAPVSNNAFLQSPKLPLQNPSPFFLNSTAPCPVPNGFAERIESSLEPGEVTFGFSFSSPEFEQPRKAGYFAPEPNLIGSAELKHLTKGQILFAFGVISIMAMLRPRFQFKYGGHDGTKIGARLTLYGHTILVEPVFPTVDGARVMGYRLALEEIKAYNPEWILPPPPWMAQLGQNGTGSGCSKIIAKRKECPHVTTLLLYSIMGNGIAKFWVDEAQNTVAHTALHAFLITENLDNPTILPAYSNLLPEVTTKKQSYKLVKEDPLTFMRESPDEERSMKTTLSPGMIPAALRRSSWREKMDNSKAHSSSPPLTAKKLKSTTPPDQQPRQEKKRKLGNSNLVPLTNCRLAEITVPEVVVDKLEALRAVQNRIVSLGPQASYDKRMKGICDAMKIGYPDIRYKKDPSSPTPSYTICAWFDKSHPYLHRASPILMATVDEKLNLPLSAAAALGIKKVIIYLLWMLKDDAGLLPNDLQYAIQLRTLKNLEMEIESDLVHRGSGN